MTLLAEPEHHKKARVRRASGFLLTAFSNATPPSSFRRKRSSRRRIRKSTSVTRTERIGVTSQNAANIHCLILFSGQNHFAIEPFPRESQVRPAIDLAIG